jgi:hypothetical protein
MTTRKFETFSIGETFRSNNGKGPWTGRIELIKDGFVYLHSTRDKSKHQLYIFRVEMWFLSSPACGWRRV